MGETNGRRPTIRLTNDARSRAHQLAAQWGIATREAIDRALIASLCETTAAAEVEASPYAVDLAQKIAEAHGATPKGVIDAALAHFDDSSSHSEREAALLSVSAYAPIDDLTAEERACIWRMRRSDATGEGVEGVK